MHKIVEERVVVQLAGRLERSAVCAYRAGGASRNGIVDRGIKAKDDLRRRGLG